MRRGTPVSCIARVEANDDEAVDDKAAWASRWPHPPTDMAASCTPATAAACDERAVAEEAALPLLPRPATPRAADAAAEREEAEALGAWGGGGGTETSIGATAVAATLAAAATADDDEDDDGGLDAV